MEIRNRGLSLFFLFFRNLIEACAVGRPVLVGMHTFNFSVVSEEAIAAGAALRVPDAKAMLHTAARLLHADDERVHMGGKALAFAKQHRGATARTMSLLKPLIR